MRVDTFAVGAAEAFATADRGARLGFDGLWFGELASSALDAVTLAAARRPAIELGTAVVGGYTASAMDLAYRLATVAAMTSGSINLGVGAQSRQVVQHQYGLRWERPLAQVAELRDALREIWSAWLNIRQPAFRGSWRRHTYCPPQGFPSVDRPCPPILLGAIGPRARALAATSFDGLIIHPCTTRTQLRSRVVPDFVAQAGKRREEDRPQLVCLPLLICTTDERRHVALRQEAKARIALWASSPIHREMFAPLGLDELPTLARRALRVRDTNRLVDLIDQAVLDEFCTIGSPEVILDDARRYYAGLCDRLAVIIDDQVDLERGRRLVGDLRALESLSG